MCMEKNSQVFGKYHAISHGIVRFVFFPSDKSKENNAFFIQIVLKKKRDPLIVRINV